MKENLLTQCLKNEEKKCNTQAEKAYYCEKVRFALIADKVDFVNYCGGKALKECDLQSLIDLLYNLGNYHMLTDFLNKNLSYLAPDSLDCDISSLEPAIDELVISERLKAIMI